MLVNEKSHMGPVGGRLDLKIKSFLDFCLFLVPKNTKNIFQVNFLTFIFSLPFSQAISTIDIELGNNKKNRGYCLSTTRK